MPENGKAEYHLLPVFDRTQSKLNLVRRHGMVAIGRNAATLTVTVGRIWLL
jgi:hypothetical protein